MKGNQRKRDGKKEKTVQRSRWRWLHMVGRCILFAGVIVLCIGSVECLAMEALVAEFGEQEEYRNLEKTIETLLDTKGEFDLSSYIGAVLSGEENISLQGIKTAVVEGIRSPFVQLKGEFVRLVAVILFTAIFTGFTRAFRNGQVAESGFYVSYLILFTMLAAGYLGISAIVSETLEHLFRFMQALIPVFSASLLISTGSATSAGAAATMLMLLALLDKVLSYVLLPCVHIYMMVILVNHLTGEAPLGKLAELILPAAAGKQAGTDKQ